MVLNHDNKEIFRHHANYIASGVHYRVLAVRFLENVDQVLDTHDTLNG